MLRRIPAVDSRVRLLVVRRLPPPLSFGISNSMKHNSIRDTKVRIAAARRNTKGHRTAAGRIRKGRRRLDVRTRSEFSYIYGPSMRRAHGGPCSSAPVIKLHETGGARTSTRQVKLIGWATSRRSDWAARED
jgi:hypothetical protein